jgi:acyl carrier protein
MTNTLDRIKNVMAGVLGMSLDEIPANAAPGVIEKWDSLRHMNLVLALEQEFGFRFTDDEMTALLTLDLILDVVSEKVARA